MASIEKPTTSPREKEWFKSSYSSARGSCVETCFTDHATLVRDSKNRRTDSPVINFSPTAWMSFLHAVTPQED
jgi:hypothetical protein